MPCCVAIGCSNNSSKAFPMKYFPRDPKRRKVWASQVKRKNWTPTSSSCLCEMHFEQDMWEKDRVDGKRKLKHNAIPTLFSFTKITTKRKPPKQRSLPKKICLSPMKLGGPTSTSEIINMPTTETDTSSITSSSIRNIWIERTQQPGRWNPNTARICSEHFVEDDYERDLKAELLNLPKRPRLKSDAVPSQNLGRYYAPQKSERTECQTRRKSKQMVAELLQTHVDPRLPNNVPVVKPEPQEPSPVIPDAEVQLHMAFETSRLKRELREEKDLIMKLRCQYSNDQQRSRNKMRKITALKQEVKELRKKRTEKYIVHEKAEYILRAVFSESQIKILLDKKKNVCWQDDEMVQAIVLRYMSKRAYIFLRTKMNYPLPSISMLKKWVSQFQIRQGILTDVINFMKIAGPTLSTREKVIIIQFDEVKLTKTVEYDERVDQVVGPYSYMQVVMVRGLFGKWKQPVFVGFDVKMTKDILFSIINSVNKAGYSVQAMVCDMGGGNRNLLDDLDLSTEKTWFLAPRNDNRKIFCIVDAPYLLTQIRNWFIDTGFVLENDSVVSPMAGLFPLLTASALSRQPPSDPDMTPATSELNNIVNAWFELMDGQTTAGEEIKCGYGLHVEEQDQKLDKMYHLMKTMRCFGKNTLQMFQRYVMISISSLKELLIELKKQFDVSYILTNRLNQNCLENFFSQIQNLGGSNNHPSPLEALSRIRIIVLKKNSSTLETDLSPAIQDMDEYLTAVVYHKSGILMPPSLEKDRTLIAEPTSSSSNTASDSDASQLPKEQNDTLSSWLQELSFGNLIEPAPTFRTQIKKWNEEFVKYNGPENLKRGEGLIRNLCDAICLQYPDIDSDVIYEFVRLRTLIRMRFMITKISSE